jgi:hypothetical protein
LYFAGLVLIFVHITLVGSLVQLIGLFIIFKSFLPDIYDSMTKIPYIGRYLSKHWLIQKATLSRTSSIIYPLTTALHVFDTLCFVAYTNKSVSMLVSVAVFKRRTVSLRLYYGLAAAHLGVEWLFLEVVSNHLRCHFVSFQFRLTRIIRQ